MFTCRTPIFLRQRSRILHRWSVRTGHKSTPSVYLPLAPSLGYALVSLVFARARDSKRRYPTESRAREKQKDARGSAVRARLTEGESRYWEQSAGEVCSPRCHLSLSRSLSTPWPPCFYLSLSPCTRLFSTLRRCLLHGQSLFLLYPSPLFPFSLSLSLFQQLSPSPLLATKPLHPLSLSLTRWV